MGQTKQAGFIPPVTSNWTGRAPRTSTEAFGTQWVDPTRQVALPCKPSILWLLALVFSMGCFTGFVVLALLVK